MAMTLRRDRIGVVADSSGIHCTLLRRGRAGWSASTSIEEGGAIAGPLKELLRGRPTAGRSADVVVALGGSWSQVRRVRGIRRTKADPSARDAVAENAGRFFLGKPDTLATTGVQWAGGEEGLAASFERSRVAELIDACRPDRLTAIVPLEALVDSSPATVAGVPPHHPLAFATSAEATPLALLAGIPACIAAALFAITAPAVAALVLGYAAQRDMNQFTHRDRAALADAQELHRLSARQQEMTTFFTRQQSPVAFMASLADAIPAGAAVVTLRMDSAGGALSLRAERIDDVVRAVVSIPIITSVEVIGPITRDAVSSRTRERVALRFRWRAAQATARSPSRVATR